MNTARVRMPTSAPAVPVDGVVNATGMARLPKFEREQLLAWVSTFADPKELCAVRLRRGRVSVDELVVVPAKVVNGRKRAPRVSTRRRNMPEGIVLPPAVAWHAGLIATKAPWADLEVDGDVVTASTETEIVDSRSGS